RPQCGAAHLSRIALADGLAGASLLAPQMSFPGMMRTAWPRRGAPASAGGGHRSNCRYQRRRLARRLVLFQLTCRDAHSRQKSRHSRSRVKVSATFAPGWG
ncbi:MAG TPA: hypothetical protein VIQ05_29895, partial [Tardiphaga sp.]